MLEKLGSYIEQSRELLGLPEDTPGDVKRKSELFRKTRESQDWCHDSSAANLWTAAFFVPFRDPDDPLVPTHERLLDFLERGHADGRLMGNANRLAETRRFFHWFLEFPEVFAPGGFDVVLGNPPWERIKLQEEEHWVEDPYIAQAPNKAQRARRIAEYRSGDDAAKRARVARFDAAKHDAEALSKFVRETARFPLTAVGDVNTYALFAELARKLLNENGRAGIIVPTGIATDDTYKEFFADLNAKRALVNLYDFENRERLFLAVDSRMKFSLLTVSAKPVVLGQFAFFCTRTEHLRDERRRFTLTPEDFALLNPNTHTCPVFRTREDAELTKKIYRRVPVLLNEHTGENPWGVKFLAMFHMSNDSHLFQKASGEGLIPLYEGKMVQAYDHRAASVVTKLENVKRPGQPVETSLLQHQDPNYQPTPQYWMVESVVQGTLPDNWKSKWFIGFKSVTSPTNERTFIATVLPWSAVANSMPVILADVAKPTLTCCLLANLNALVFDYVAKQKTGGVNLNFFIMRQFPLFPPGTHASADVDFFTSRVLELVYTACDMKPFAEDMGYHGEPFPWDEDRRAILRAELDAYYAHLYGLTRDELRYILDPKEVYGEDFPGETFRVLKENEKKKYGEYRTQRLVLEAYDRLASDFTRRHPPSVPAG